MQIEPMDSVLDPEVRSTVLMWASQTAGKTELINNIVGYFIHQDPAPILIIQPDLNMAEAWSKDRFDTMVRDTQVLSELVLFNRKKARDNKILHKKFPGGHVTIAGANSPASLASRPIRVNLFDEIDRYEESAGKEGDPIMLAEKRSDTFWNAVNFKTSTPTIKNHSRIEKEFLRSDQCYWFVRCPHCESEQMLKWSNVKWPKGDPKATYYLCGNLECSSHWTDEERVAAVWAGRWIATAPFAGVRGYHLNGIYSLFKAKKGYINRLHQMAAEFQQAYGLGKHSRKVWVNTFLSETFEEDADVKPEWSRLFDRRIQYPHGKIPSGVRIITAGVDFQKDRIELEFVGYGVGEESYGLGHHVLPGDPRMPSMYAGLEQLLGKEFVRQDGARLSLAAAGFDTGYAACQRQLYSWLRPRLGRFYFAFKGANTIDAEPISLPRKSKTDQVRLIMVGTNRIKTYLYSRATIEFEGPGYMHFSEDYSAEWFKQLLSEDCYSVIRMGVTYRTFKLPEATPEGGTDRNEALDCRVYSLGALYARGAQDWDSLERRNLLTIPEDYRTDDQNKVISSDPGRRKKKTRRQSSFMSSLQMR